MAGTSPGYVIRLLHSLWSCLFAVAELCYEIPNGLYLSIRGWIYGVRDK